MLNLLSNSADVIEEGVEEWGSSRVVISGERRLLTVVLVVYPQMRILLGECRIIHINLLLVH